tara:strand:- start:316 stop:981 length:666 start_codon:yes stop_codon:yes gene_type:complete
MINKFLRIGVMFLSFGVLFCDANEQAKPMFDEISCDYEYATSTTLEEKLYFYESEDHKQKLMALAYTVKNGAYERQEIPTVGLRTRDGWLVGSSYFDTSEIQHGVLAYLNSQNKPTKLLNEPIEDIYVMSFGYLVVAGGVRTLSPQIRHLDVSFGSLYVVQIKNQIATIEKLFELNEEPQTSWKTKSGDVIINYHKSSVLLNKNAVLKNIICSDYQYQELQ